MGFHQEYGGGNITYAGFANGQIVLRSREAITGYTERVNKLGNTVYEQHHPAFTGRLQEIQFRDGDYGAQWVFKFKDKGDLFAITDRVNGSYAKGIITALANESFDPAKDVTLSPWRMDDPRGGDKYMVGCAVKQDGQRIARAYVSPNVPEDKRNGAKLLPPMQEVKVSGKTVLDDSDTIDLLTKLVEEINAKVSKAAGVVQASGASKPQTFDEMMEQHRAKATSGPVPDDVPF